MEFATIYIGLGTKVTILEGAPRLLGPLDREFSQSIKMILKKRGADIHTGAMVKSFERLEDGPCGGGQDTSDRRPVRKRLLA